MATVDDVRRIASALPRTTEHLVHDRVKFRIGSIVYVGLSRDEEVMGFAFPKEEREALVAADPDRYLMPVTSDLRFNWVLVCLAALSVEEVEEHVVEAWRMCVPRRLPATTLEPPDVIRLESARPLSWRVSSPT